MSWKKRLNVNESIINADIDNYLKKHEFYEHTMSPRFFGEETYSSNIIGRGAPCLRLDTDVPQNSKYTMRIFINETEVYMEVQNSWGSFDRSYHIALEEPLALGNIDSILDKVSQE